MVVDDLIRRAGAEIFAVDPDSFKELNGTDAAVYTCRKGSRGYVMKFVPKAENEIPMVEEQLGFMHYLTSHGIPIAMPVKSPGGNLYERLQVGNQIYLVLLMPLADGRHPQSRNLYDWNESLFHTWGQVMGKMHALTQQYPTWEKPEGAATRILDWREGHRFFTDWCKEPKIVEKWEPLYEALDKLPRDRTSFGLIHNDLHQQNFFYQPDARGVHPITIIDFDVCAYHWFITDISIALYHAMSESGSKSLAERRSFSRIFLSHFMQGYRKENSLDEGWFIHLPLFLKYRDILIYIALTNSWPEEQQKPWQKRFLAEKRSRTLRDDPIL